MSALRRPIERALKDGIDEAFVRRAWEGAGRRRRKRARGAGIRLGFALAAGMALIAIALVSLREPLAPEPAAPAIARIETLDVSGASTVHLADGSWIRLRDGARLVTRRSSPEELALELFSGGAEFYVQPRGRPWSIDAGLAEIRVLGTDFSIVRSDDSVEVAVARGEVTVLSEHLADRMRVIASGQSIVVRPPEPATPEPARLSPARPALAPKAKRTEIAEADRLRIAGRHREAIELLEKFARESPAHPEAPLAVYTIGEIYLFDLDRPEEAKQAFARAESMGLPRALQDAVRARLR